MSSRSRLKEILKDKSMMHGNFTLASGQSSDVYLDARITVLDPEGMFLISEIFLAEIAENHSDAEAVGCSLSVGAGPIMGSMVCGSKKTDRPLRGMVVRDKRKSYGTEKIVEWEPGEGSQVIMIEDVINTGGSVLRAVKHAEAEGAKVRAVFCVVDRGTDTEQVFLGNGYRFFSIFKLSELL